MTKYVRNVEGHLDDLKQNLERGELNVARAQKVARWRLLGWICSGVIVGFLYFDSYDATIWGIIFWIIILMVIFSAYSLGELMAQAKMTSMLLDDFDKFLLDEERT